MRILVVNPNTTAAMTDRLTGVAAAAVPDVDLVPLTAARGFSYISSRAEAQVAGVVALEMIAANLRGADAAVIAAFGDPGLRAARELFDIPVVGMAEAAILTACMLGERFGIVTFTPRMIPWFAESVAAAGLEARFAGFRTPPEALGPVHGVAEAMRGALSACVDQAAALDGADAVILGGAPLAGLAASLPDAPAVLVDPVAAAVLHARSLALLSPRGAHRGRFARPPLKPGVGLDPALGALMGGAN